MPAEDEHAAQRQRGDDAPEQQPRPALVGHAEVGEQQQEDEQVVERERALDQVDGGVEDRVVAALEQPSTERRPAGSATSQPIDQTTASWKLGSRPRAKKCRSSQRKTSSAAIEHRPGVRRLPRSRSGA